MGSLFIWDKSRYELKVAEMDQEHQTLVDIMNNLYEQNRTKQTKAEILQTVHQLLAFVVLHFQHEEAYLDKIRFPGLSNHKGIHQRLLSQLKQHAADFESSSSPVIPNAFFDFLTLWLSAHIQHIDMQYSPSRFKQSA